MLTLALTRAIENVRRRSLVYAEYAKPIDTASADLSKYEEAVEYVTEAISQITESRNEVQTLLQQIASEIGTARKSNKAALKKELDDALEAANFKMIDSESDGLLISLGTIKAQIKGKIRSLQRIEANEVLSAPSRMSDNILAGYASRMDLQNLGQLPGSVLDPLQPLLNGPVAQSTPMPITNSRRNSVLSNHQFRPISPQSSSSSRSQSFFIDSDEAPVRPPRSSDSLRSCSAKTHEENIQNLETQKAQNLPAVHQAARFTPFVPDSPIASENEGPTRRIYSTRAPKIKIPEFDGNRLKFSEFWSVFNLVVHDNPELTEAEKMIHLKNSLKGSAALVIEGIQLVPQNYSWMISALKKKYERTAHNRQQIIAELNGLPACHSDPEDCAEHLQKVRALMNRMRSTGADVGKAIDGTWLTIVASKFPQSLLEQVHSKMRHVEDCNVDDFLDQLEEIIEDKRYAKAAVQATNNFVAKQKDSQPPSAAYRKGLKTELCTLCEKGAHSACECRTISNPEERFQVIRDKKLCLVCFQKHPTKFCKVHKKCGRCSYRHHESICSQAQSWFNKSDSQGSDNRPQTKPTSEQNKMENHRNKPKRGNPENEVQMTPVLHNDAPARQLVLMTAEVSVSNSATGDSEKVVVFFDSGSMISFIDAELAKRLQLLPKRTEVTEITGISGIREKFTSNVVEVQFNTPYGSRTYANLKTKSRLTNEFGAAALGKEDLQFLKDCNIILSNPRIAGQMHKPDILIGLDLFQHFVRDLRHERLPCGLFIARTILGCCAWGVGTSSISEQQQLCQPVVGCFPALVEKTEHEMLRELFELEGVGLQAQADHNSLSYFEKYRTGIRTENGIITAPLPLKENASEILDNYPLALSRLAKLQKHLMAHPEQLAYYAKTLEGYISDDVIEEVSSSARTDGVYYMPHSGVWRSEKPNPLRIVFDASSKRRGTWSLNEVCHTGKMFTKKLFEILVNIRKPKIILLCDLQAAFTQIRLLENQRDYCRFLWVKDPNKPATQDNIVRYRFKRLPFGLTCSPSVLNMALANFLLQKQTPLADEILNNLYVDNILLSADTEEEAISKYCEIKRLFQEISVNVREFISNSANVNYSIPEHDRGRMNNCKILGVLYDINTDHLSVSIGPKIHLKNESKRAVLSSLNSVFDPLGFLTPLMLQMKLHFREATKDHVDWKEPIHEQLLEKWQTAASQLEDYTGTIPRYIENLNDKSDIKLWVMVDASNEALSACAYFQTENQLSSLICGKNKLAPLKRPLTIPQLELAALLMGTTLAKSIIDAAAISRVAVKVASDSMIALSWLKSHKRLMLSVASQCDKIRKLKRDFESEGHSLEFFHVPSALNVADLATRTVKCKNFGMHDWLYGPKWLQDCDYSQLTTFNDIVGNEINLPEEKPVAVLTSTILEEPKPLIELTRFSNYSRLLRATAYAMKTLTRWVERTNRNRNQTIMFSSGDSFSTALLITAQDNAASEKLLLRLEHEHVDLSELKKRFHNIDIVKDDDGIIRQKTRLFKSALPRDAVEPILLLPKSQLTTIILDHFHRNNGHPGQKHLEVLLRQRFWLPGPTRIISRYLKKCVTCAKAQGLPFGGPAMPSLPADRVNITRPFEKTGVDCFGPYTANDGSKLYGCLFTCLATRAVHLEGLHDMSAVTFLNCLMRFISRRGVPTLIRSDNGGNFILAEKVLNLSREADEPKDNVVLSYCADNKINWAFNIPSAPWTGGVWERLVASVKKAYSKMIGRKRLTLDQFVTTLATIEAILNTRPLTVMRKKDSSYLPLRPVDFLCGQLKYSVGKTELTDADDPDYEPGEGFQNMAQATEAFNSVTELMNVFWKRWQTEYLTTIRDIAKSKRKQPRHKKRTEPDIGEVVLIENHLQPRGSWSYGRIQAIVPSSDGMTRAAQVQLPNGRSLLRPLNQLYPLEIPAVIEGDRANDETQTTGDMKMPPDTVAEPEKVNGSTRTQPPRAAKTRGRQLVRNQAKTLVDDDREGVILSMNPLIRAKTALLICSLMTLIAPCSTIKLTNRSEVRIPSNFDCDHGWVHIPENPSPAELCYNTACFTIPTSNQLMLYRLPVTTRHDAVQVTFKAGRFSHKTVCTLPHLCEVSQTLLSAALIGNPHCWPLGAIITACLILYFATTAVVFIGWTTFKLGLALLHFRHRRAPS